MKKKVHKEESPKVKKLKEKAREYSIREGMFASIRSSFGDYYVSPFAIAIQASNSLVALLTSAMGILGPISQIAGSKLIEKHSRKSIILKTVFLESLMWIPLILTAILFKLSMVKNILPLVVLITFGMYTIFANLHHPSWFSWMGDLVEEKHRGKYFSKRNLIIGFISILLATFAAIFLESLKAKGLEMEGFAILFTLAFIARLISRNIFKKQYEPKLVPEEKEIHSFWKFLIEAQKTNVGKFTIYRSLIAFAASISIPLVAVYLLRILNFTYTQYILVTLGGTFIALFTLEVWGKISDKYGNYKTTVLSALIIPFVPILYLLNENLLYLIFIPSLLSSIAWAGMHLASGNFLYDTIPASKRATTISYFNMLRGIGIALGAGLGAFLIKILENYSSPIIPIFIMSAVTRAAVSIWWLPKIKEVRDTKKFSANKALKHLLFKEAKPILLEEAHEIASIKNYLTTE